MTGTVSGGGSPQVFTVNTADPALAAGLSDVSINDGGMVVANLSDHSTDKRGPILLANFPEPNGPDRVDGIVFLETAKSSSVVYASAADHGHTAAVCTDTVRRPCRARGRNAARLLGVGVQQNSKKN